MSITHVVGAWQFTVPPIPDGNVQLWSPVWETHGLVGGSPFSKLGHGWPGLDEREYKASIGGSIVYHPSCMGSVIPLHLIANVNGAISPYHQWFLQLLDPSHTDLTNGSQDGGAWERRCLILGSSLLLVKRESRGSAGFSAWIGNGMVQVGIKHTCDSI